LANQKSTLAAIEIKDLIFRFSSDMDPVLCVPTWRVEPNERIFLHGDSGSGKSTLLGLLAGLRKPTSGDVTVLGTSISTLSGRKRDAFRAKNIGVVFQQFNLIPFLSVLDNILLAAEFAQVSSSAVRARGLELLERVNLDPALSLRKASQLSIGQQQRVAIVRALINSPALLLVDEPTSALDQANKESFLTLLNEVLDDANCAMIFVSHDPSIGELFEQASCDGRSESDDGGKLMGRLRALFNVAYQSLLYRLGGVTLAVAAVTISVFVLLSVEHVRHEARSSFASTVSNVDLIVGARTGEINLLLLSIFRIGNPTANIEWKSVEKISEQQNVEWVVPISLGDSHKNFRVVGTTAEFFDRYMYGQNQPLGFDAGGRFDNTLDVVVGRTGCCGIGLRSEQ
jgi:putative ABC transport system ATP-binding protein